MKELFVVTLAVLLLIGTLWSAVLLVVNVLPTNTSKLDCDVHVVVHVNDELKPALIKSMLKDLEVVKGIQLCVWVGDNTTSAMWDAKHRLSKWLGELEDYKIVIQCDYAFAEKYGYYEYPYWKYNDTETLSRIWYKNWYGNLSEVLNKHSNVMLMVGFNEAYNHFRTKEMAQSIMKREYVTWKNMSNIPFSTEFLMPYTYWADHWSFPSNASIESDCVPFWRDYSDYIGVNLWADNRPPQYGFSPDSLERAKQQIEIFELYSKQLKKPIHCNEFPAWDREAFRYICDKVMRYPNVGQCYQLWYWGGQEEKHYDAWTYGLYNVDPQTHGISRGEPSWSVFTDVLNPQPTRKYEMALPLFAITSTFLGVTLRHLFHRKSLSKCDTTSMCED
jgi:hypothetical protein